MATVAWGCIEEAAISWGRVGGEERARDYHRFQAITHYPSRVTPSPICDSFPVGGFSYVELAGSLLALRDYLEAAP